MGNWKHRCNGHWHESRPHNWTLVGGTKAFTVLSDESDSTYAKSPASKHRLQLTFPQDPEDLPTGAIITSVTFFVRANRTTSKPRPLKVEISAKDRPYRSITRTIYPSTSISDIEVGTYKKDPRGFRWDIHRLNKLIVSFKAWHAVFDSIRVYDIWAQVNYHVMPAVTVDAPSGTVQTASPTIEWTYTHSEGDALLKSELKLFTATEKNKTSFDPAKSPPVYSVVLQGDTESHLLPVSINPDTYVAYVRVTSVHGSVSLWANRQFSVTSPAPAAPGDDNAGVAGTPGVGVISVVPNSFESSAKLTMRESSNLLSVNQADFEQSNDPVGFHDLANCTVARSTSTFYPGGGSASLEISASASGQVRAGARFFEIAPSTPVTVVAQVLAGSVARECSVRLRLYDSDYTQIQEISSGDSLTSTTTWTELSTTGVTHADAVFGNFMVFIESAAGAGEKHYIDHCGVMYGTDSAWSHGGHSSRNILAGGLTSGQDSVTPFTWSAGNSASTFTRPSASGTGHQGASGKMNRMTYAGAAASIGIRATGSAFSSPTSGTDFTLNKPAGVVDNDLLLAFVSATESSAVMTPPSGWTEVTKASVNDGSTDVALWVLKKTGQTVDPSTWTDGSLSVAASRRRATVVAYTGAAAAESQFINQGVTGDSGGNTVHTTATISNTDSNAWRVAAFAASDDAGSLTSIANITPPSTVNISYVGSSTWASESVSTSWQINRPSGVQSGDLMIATAMFTEDSITTVNAPSGWTLVRKVNRGGPTPDDDSTTFAVFKRTAGSSEPSSWSSTTSASSRCKASIVAAYRNAETSSLQFIAENASGETSGGGSITTPTVTNTDSRAWRVCAFAFNSGFDENITSTEASERAEVGTDLSGFWEANLAWFDSNGPVSTGSHSRTGSLSESPNSSVAWIALLKPKTGTSPGANETERSDSITGSAAPFLQTAIYDSNAVVPLGPTNVTAQYTLGSGSTMDSVVSWVGLIRPATDSGGVVAAKTSTYMDISELDPEVLELADNKCTALASFVGNQGGTPSFTLFFYRGNTLISSSIGEGAGFGTDSFRPASAEFDLPTGTTGVQLMVSVSGRDIGDTVDWVRAGVNLGTSTVWGEGTQRDFHPVWSLPVIQYSEDAGAGYGDWALLPGQSAYRPVYDDLNGQVKYFDHTVTPLVKRRYRVQTKTYGKAGDVSASGYGPPSEEVSLEAIYWWLKDLQDLSQNISIDVKKQSPLSVGTINTATVFQPLGEDYPLVISEGYKADTFEISVFIKREKYAQLVRMLKSKRTLFLQSNIDNAWWVRPVGDIQADTLLTSQLHTDPIREVKLQFVQVKPED